LLGVLLTAVAGFVDAIAYLGLGGLFASFMSGASVSLGLGLKSGHWQFAVQGVFMIASFLAGVTLGTILSGITGPWALPAVLFVEAIFLAGAALLAGFGWTVPTSILPVAAAMGVQNTALQPVDGVRLGVTFITGTLVSLGQALGKALLGRAGGWRLRGHALLWCALVAGAVAGALLNGAFGPIALIVPAILVTFLALLSTMPVLAKLLRGLACPSRDPESNRPPVWPYY
jgi:uncharacterized membrane protein YoaK (UPF0700 family)